MLRKHNTKCRQSHDRIQRIIEPASRQHSRGEASHNFSRKRGNIVRVRGQTNDQTRRPRSEGEAAEDHQEHHVEKRIHLEVNQMITGVEHRGCEEARDHHNEGAEKEIISRQRSNSMTSSRCSPQKQHRQIPTVQAVQKTVEVHRQSCRHLREHAEVNADGAGSARTAQKDKFAHHRT